MEAKDKKKWKTMQEQAPDLLSDVTIVSAAAVTVAVTVVVVAVEFLCLIIVIPFNIFRNQLNGRITY